MAPDLRFTDYFTDHNERDHNIDEGDVVDAYYGRRVKFSKLYERNGRKRREILAKNDDLFMNIIVEPIFDGGREVWDVLSAWPADENEKRMARQFRVGEFTDD
jgi:hypothetical protein